MSLLEKNPDDRPQKASSVIRTLVEIAGRPLNLAGFGLAIRNDRPVGREKDLQTMETVLDGTSGRALLVTGGAGSGLVGFANMAAMRARERKIAVLVSTLHQEDPLKNLVEVILEAGESMEASIGSKLDTACMGLRKILAKPLIGRWKRRELLYIAVNTVLREKIEKQQLPILLVVHHQHLARPLVLELLVRLVRTATNDSLPLQFLFTADPVHLHQYGNARHRFPGALRLQLKPLDVRQVALSVGSMLYRRPPPLRAARYIHQISGGEPLWIERVVYELVELGALRVYGVEGNHLEWDPEAAKTLEIPLRAKQAVMKSLMALSKFGCRGVAWATRMSISGQD